MTVAQKKVVQYLSEAHASEQGLTRVLESQIAMTPRGSYRAGLETHLDETRSHAVRIAARLGDLGQASNPLVMVFGLAETAIGQMLALGKMPIDLMRGTGGAEKVLKNARDACASEALEIATYTALERLARDSGDTETADLAASILADEEKMLKRVLREIPKLTAAVVSGKYDLATTGAGEALRDAASATRRTAARAEASSKRTARKARKVPGVAHVEGQVKGAMATESDLAIARYNSLTADEIISKLPEQSQIELAKVAAYERKNQNRVTVLGRLETLRKQEPWAGYDELTVGEVKAVLSAGDDQRAESIRAYERSHKSRAGVLDAAKSELAKA